MLCSACQEIFSRPRKLAYASIQPWTQTPETFKLAKELGCHLCHLIEAARGYDSIKGSSSCFPNNISYAFKPINPNWARYGVGLKWYAFQSSKTEDDQEELEEFRQGVELDPTANNLAHLLATDAPNLRQEAASSWMVLQFYGRENIVLPIELFDPDDPFEEIAQNHLESQTWTGSLGTLKLAKSWLENCCKNHFSCGARNPSNAPFLPTRLLDVGTIDSPCLRLVYGSSLDPKSPYIALSHRWETNQTRVLRVSNVENYQTAIPEPDITPTVQDAATVTRALGIQYLWIDCLCIIQDDDGTDWSKESSTMFKVYSLSACTIAAAASPKPNQGFLRQRSPLAVRPYIAPSPFSTNNSLCGSPYKFKIHPPYLNRLHDAHVRSSEWFKRGWVFQERMLAPRLLIFSSSQLLWGCPMLQAAESWPSGKTGTNFIDQFTSVAEETKRLYALFGGEKSVRRSHVGWWEFLGDYMSSELTVGSDRLPAVQGIAEMISSRTGVKYFAGFWLDADDFLRGLLWEVKDGEEKKPEGGWRAPRFSWACVEGEVKFDCAGEGRVREEDKLMKVLEGVKMGGTGRNIGEALRVKGKLLAAAVLTGDLDGGDGTVEHRIVTRENGRLQAEIYRKELEFKESVVGRAQENIIATTQAAKSKGLQVLESIMWPLIVLLSPLILALFIVALGLAIAVASVALGVAAACVGVAIALVPIGAAVFYSSKLLSHFYWTHLYPRIYADRLSREAAERARERTAHEEEMLRRQRVAEEKAQRVFEDLEKGVIFEDPKSKRLSKANQDGDKPLKMSLNSDFRLPSRQVIEVFVLPILQEVDIVWGLMVQVAKDSSDQYERLGTFQTTKEEIAKLQLLEATLEEFFLV
ncbi:heterokaryon incompatibility protein-domain-containing protein [Podospora fimiseda]|uniref:Heterokaryon incompatibility protein-domain-containing protein n=1 Tax=Podospora fimiseda TaxID=252190 RepID=A0AAN7BJW7_9PEZI|nr:heterokaryon incompatibility protein-domain-containing protein [Podospora fimiseda]